VTRAALVRLVAFVLVIAGTFGTAYGLGRRLPGNPESKPHTHGPVKPSLIPPGFAVDGYVLIAESNQPSASLHALDVNGPDGQRITTYTAAQGAKLHVVMTHPDLSGFVHLTPDLAADGTFIVPIAKPGKWHIIIDAQPVGRSTPIVLATNVDDEVPIGDVKLPAETDKVTLDDLTIVRHGLSFTVTAKDGSAAKGLEPYLGQPAQLFVLHKDDLGYTHPAPVDAPPATFSFEGTLAPGTYRLFLQFGYRGDVRTVAFTVVQP
jgi:hypothetical protein